MHVRICFVRLVSDWTNSVLILWLGVLLLGGTYEEGVGFVWAVMAVNPIRSTTLMYGSLHSSRKPGGECEYIAQVHRRGSLPLLEL